MKKKVVIGLITLGVLSSVFGITYTVRSNQLEAQANKKMTDKQVEEIDSYEVKSFTVTCEDKKYKNLEDMKDLEAGTIVDCKVKLASGKTVETEGYITKGDQNHISYDGNSVKITLQKTESTNNSTDTDNTKGSDTKSETEKDTETASDTNKEADNSTTNTEE